MAKHLVPTPSAFSIREQVLQGKLSPKDSAAQALQMIEKHNDELGALLFVDKDGVADQVQAVETKLKKGATAANLPLAGVPLVIKDNISQNGKPLTCGSKILQGFVASYDATVVTKLRDAGAILMGNANMDEFAMGSSTENSAYQLTRNPHDLTRVPGGSSGGSAAAVAAGMVSLSLGSDTGGSVRQPASFCGVVGHKPTYGRVSRFGLVAYASSLDQIGPLARSVSDAALLFDVISGPDERDATSLLKVPTGASLQAIENIRGASGKPLAGKKVGVVKEFLGAGLQDDVKKAVTASFKTLESLGAQVVELSLPRLADSISTYYLVATAEASSNLSRFDGIRYGYSDRTLGSNLQDIYQNSRGGGFGQEVKRRILLGTYALSSGYKNAYYEKALRVRQMIADSFAEAFGKVDALVSPTAPSTAFKIGEKTLDPLAMYLEDIYTVPVNLAGIPALSLNCGADELGLPIGLQLMGRHGADEDLFAMAFALEREWAGGGV